VIFPKSSKRRNNGFRIFNNYIQSFFNYFILRDIHITLYSCLSLFSFLVANCLAKTQEQLNMTKLIILGSDLSIADDNLCMAQGNLSPCLSQYYPLLGIFVFVPAFVSCNKARHRRYDRRYTLPLFLRNDRQII